MAEESRSAYPTRSADHHAASSEGISCGIGARMDWRSQRVVATGEPQSGGGRGRREVVRTKIPPPARLRRVLREPWKRSDDLGKLVPTRLSERDKQRPGKPVQ
jgi:hypothetical protein